jgi:hypothetical protein
LLRTATQAEKWLVFNHISPDLWYKSAPSGEHEGRS